MQTRGSCPSGAAEPRCALFSSVVIRTATVVCVSSFNNTERVEGNWRDLEFWDRCRDGKLHQSSFSSVIYSHAKCHTLHTSIGNLQQVQADVLTKLILYTLILTHCLKICFYSFVYSWLFSYDVVLLTF